MGGNCLKIYKKYIIISDFKDTGLILASDRMNNSSQKYNTCSCSDEEDSTVCTAV